jgi:UDP-glucose 4-epimerase
MNILLTGGLGFIGHNVAHQLELLGHSISIIDRCRYFTTIPEDVQQYLFTERTKKIKTTNISKAELFQTSLLNWELERNSVDVVIHLASLPNQKTVATHPSGASLTMNEGLISTLEACVKQRVKKFVYISSSMVYGDFTDGARETQECHPHGLYAILKYAGELIVKDYAERTGMQYVIIRPSAVYGVLDTPDRVVPKFLLAAMRNETLEVAGSNERLDFTYVDDVARGIVKATISESANNNTYNITRGRARSLLEAAELAIAIAGGGRIQINERNRNYPSRGALSIGAARHDFHYTPLVDIEEGFRLYYDWLNNSIYRTA